MQVVGIIAEYNPFHYGHAHQIAQVRRRHPDVCIVAVMSGSFTQRGTPCILDKWTRAGHAVVGGADLVLELPFAFACRSAQDFARGGISLLAHLGVVSHLAFGMEAEELAPLTALTAQIDTDVVQMRLHAGLSDGLSYAGALTRALTCTVDVCEDMLRAPNNILAIEYMRALRSLAPQIVPIGIRRTAAQHDDTRLRRGITSASSIRTALGASPPPWAELEVCVMPSVLDDLQKAYHTGIPREDTLIELLRYLLLVTESSARAEIYGITEGIENRLIRCLETAERYTDFLLKTATKRYPQSRIARLIVHLLLHFQKTQAAYFDASGVSYIRPLAFNMCGRTLLHAIKKASPLPIVTRTAAFLSTQERGRGERLSPLQQMLSFDTRATELRLLTQPMAAMLRRRTDFITSPKFISI